MRIEADALTDQGNTRKKNEDAYGIYRTEQFYVVADGVGGQQAGEVAAKETVDQLFYGVHRLFNLLANCSEDEVQNLLKLNVDETNQVVINKGKAHSKLKGMASTFCFIFVFSDMAYYSHYGDSRIYLYREKKLKALTKDHTVAQELLESKSPSISKAQKNTLTKAIGLTGSQKASIDLIPIKKGDIFFLCSDGIFEGLGEGHLAQYLSKSQSSKETLKEIILDARNRGAKDNITAIILNVT
ncbi:MAG: Serine/threonine phosphatase stp [Chlamydiae bacterium]|nr:Serine/threonine phosphatase stp [Chlamydiota bacterium]